MSRNCDCGKNTGGTNCPEGNYAVCKLINNKCVGYCYEPPKGLNQTEKVNWFLNHVLESERELGKQVDDTELAILTNGSYQYTNELGEAVKIKFDAPLEIMAPFISTRDYLIMKYAADIKEKFGESANMELLEKVTIGLGPSIYNIVSFDVSSDDKKKLETIKKNYLMKKLGMQDSPKLIDGIKTVVDKYGPTNRNKHRAVLYYMLSKHFKKEPKS